MNVIEGQLINALLSGVIGGLIAWGGLRVELRWMRRDVDSAHTRLDRQDERLRELERSRL